MPPSQAPRPAPPESQTQVKLRALDVGRIEYVPAVMPASLPRIAWLTANTVLDGTHVCKAETGFSAKSTGRTFRVSSRSSRDPCRSKSNTIAAEHQCFAVVSPPRQGLRVTPVAQETNDLSASVAAGWNFVSVRARSRIAPPCQLRHVGSKNFAAIQRFVQLVNMKLQKKATASN
jgi:hypothetical protein